MGNYLLCEISLTDGDGHDKNTLCGNELDHILYFGFLQIEGTGDFGKKVARTEVLRQPTSWRTGLLVRGATVGNEHQRVIGKIFNHRTEQRRVNASGGKGFYRNPSRTAYIILRLQCEGQLPYPRIKIT
jgi:hypothetical protein